MRECDGEGVRECDGESVRECDGEGVRECDVAESVGACVGWSR